jgi:uncharacterized Zn-binding protein involved in type VI secretion
LVVNFSIDAPITVGATLSHGGEVTEGSPTLKVYGEAVCTMGNRAECDQHGATHIATASGKSKTNGAAIAIQGDTTACGATLNATPAVVNGIRNDAIAQASKQEPQNDQDAQKLRNDPEALKALYERDMQTYRSASPEKLESYRMFVAYDFEGNKFAFSSKVITDPPTIGVVPGGTIPAGRVTIQSDPMLYMYLFHFVIHPVLST